MRLRVSLIALCLSLAAVAAAKGHQQRVKFVTTMGSFVVQLYDETPQHRDNFLRLAREGYFDGLLFHRVIAHFMVQAGDPDSRDAASGVELGEGGPGYTLPSEFRTPQLFHVRGAVAAAREADAENPERRSSGSQFYVVWGRRFDDATLRRTRQQADRTLGHPLPLTPQMYEAYRLQGGTPHLDGQYTVFGRVVKGLKVIECMQRVATDENDRPLNDVRILTARPL